MRTANAIDFWRGYALVTIFLNHIPDAVLARLTHRRWSISDSAEIFVFLAGYAVALSSRRDFGRRWTVVAGRFGRRAFNIYAGQLLTTGLAVLMVSAAALWFRSSEPVEAIGAQILIHSGASGVVDLILMRHPIGMFNILPLYVVLVIGAAPLLLLHRASPALAIGLSALLYASSVALRLDYPVQGEDRWFFNPLAWQFLFMIGIASGRARELEPFLERHQKRIWPVAAAITLASCFAVGFRLLPDPVEVSTSWTSYLLNKTFLGPVRLLQFLALAIFALPFFPYLQRYVPGVVDLGSLLGRHSLRVFCAASLLSLGVHLLRMANPYHRGIDILLSLAGIAVMISVAWHRDVEMRRLKEGRAPEPSMPASAGAAAQ